MEDKKKMIYSLNLIAFVSMRTCLTPEMHRDEKGLFYAIFPETQGVKQAIREWRNPETEVNIHAFLDVYRQLRETIAEHRRKIGEIQ